MLPPFVGPEHVRAAQWQGLKQRPTQFASNKNIPGTDYAPKEPVEVKPDVPPTAE